MKKTLPLFALGALALAGCDFAGSTDSATAPIASIQATQLSGGEGQADLYVEVQDATGRSFFRSAPTSATAGAVAVEIPAGFEIPRTTMPMHVAVYDYGTSYNDSDLLARSSAFTAADLAAAPQIERADASGFYGHQATAARFTISSAAAQ